MKKTALRNALGCAQDIILRHAGAPLAEEGAKIWKKRPAACWEERTRTAAAFSAGR
jgi:hypothetical protein